MSLFNFSKADFFETTVPPKLNLTLASIYLLASANTFPSSSQQMLASKGSMLSSKGNMLSCMILLAIEHDVHAQLLPCIIVQSVDVPEQDYMLSHACFYLRFKLDAQANYSTSIQ